MKFLHNSKRHPGNDKKGGMLLLVLVIFGMALILISSALTISLASRDRYYVDAELSQERLTLVCAAETFVDMLENQEFTDEMLRNAIGEDLIITGASTSDPEAGPSAVDGKSIAPGLSGIAGTSYTKCTVSEDSGSDDIFVDFSTVIDATGLDQNAEKLRIRLHYVPPTPPPDICPNMITTGEVGATNDFPKLNIQTRNYFTVLHGDSTTNSSAAYYRNKVVFTGKAYLTNGTLFYNDVIFYGPDAGVDKGSLGNGLITDSTSSFYFLGCDLDDGSKSATIQHAILNSNGTPSADDGSGFNFKARSAFFYNSEINIKTWTGMNDNCKYFISDSSARVNINRGWNGNNVLISANGGVTNAPYETIYTYAQINDGSHAAELAEYNNVKSKASDYMAGGGELFAAVSHQVPEADAYSSYKKAGIPISNSDTTLNGGKSYTMSGYYAANCLEIDLSYGDATITMTGDTTFRDYYIKVDNSYGNHLYIVLDPGVSFIMMDQCDKCKDTGRTCGVVSTYHQSEDWTKAEFPVENPQIRGQAGTEPACVIVGNGSNTLSAARACTVDAYISLAGRGADASTVILKDKVNFYGRVEAVYLNQGCSDDLMVYDCPKLGSGSTGEQPLSTNYTATEYEFYY